MNEEVYFTSDGFNHLLRESNRQPRNQKEQILKLECLPFAPKVIQRCKIIVTTRKKILIVKGIAKSVVRYGLVYEVAPGKKIRVIVEKVGSGKCRFLSVMPHDKQSKTKKRPSGRSSNASFSAST